MKLPLSKVKPINESIAKPFLITVGGQSYITLQSPELSIHDVITNLSQMFKSFTIRPITVGTFVIDITKEYQCMSDDGRVVTVEENSEPYVGVAN